VGIPRDVFAEDTIRPALADNTQDLIDEESFIIGPALAAGDAVGLAGISASEAMNVATPWSSIEGGKVSPDRSRMKPPRFHARDQARGGSGFPLHVSDAARSGFGNSDAELKAANSCADSEGVKFGT
jgi:hypothetical protein